MIYKIHKPCDNIGNRGQFIGYINLCHGYINQSHIYTELLKSKMINEDFRSNDLIVSGAHSGISGVSAFNVYKKRRRPVFVDPNVPRAIDKHEQMFYLHPLLSLDSKSDYWMSFSGDIVGGTSAGTAVTYHNIVYPIVQNIALVPNIVPQPNLPIQNPAPNPNRR